MLDAHSRNVSEGRRLHCSSCHSGEFHCLHPSQSGVHKNIPHMQMSNCHHLHLQVNKIM